MGGETRTQQRKSPAAPVRAHGPFGGIGGANVVAAQSLLMTAAPRTVDSARLGGKPHGASATARRKAAAGTAAAAAAAGPMATPPASQGVITDHFASEQRRGARHRHTVPLSQQTAAAVNIVETPPAGAERAALVGSGSTHRLASSTLSAQSGATVSTAASLASVTPGDTPASLLREQQTMMMMMDDDESMMRDASSSPVLGVSAASVASAFARTIGETPSSQTSALTMGDVSVSPRRARRPLSMVGRERDARVHGEADADGECDIAADDVDGVAGSGRSSGAAISAVDLELALRASQEPVLHDSARGFAQPPLTEQQQQQQQQQQEPDEPSAQAARHARQAHRMRRRSPRQHRRCVSLDNEVSTLPGPVRETLIRRKESFSQLSSGGVPPASQLASASGVPVSALSQAGTQPFAASQTQQLIGTLSQSQSQLASSFAVHEQTSEIATRVSAFSPSTPMRPGVGPLPSAFSAMASAAVLPVATDDASPVDAPTTLMSQLAAVQSGVPFAFASQGNSAGQPTPPMSFAPLHFQAPARTLSQMSIMPVPPTHAAARAGVVHVAADAMDTDVSHRPATPRDFGASAVEAQPPRSLPSRALFGDDESSNSAPQLVVRPLQPAPLPQSFMSSPSRLAPPSPGSGGVMPGYRSLSSRGLALDDDSGGDSGESSNLSQSLLDEHSSRRAAAAAIAPQTPQRIAYSYGQARASSPFGASAAQPSAWSSRTPATRVTPQHPVASVSLFVEQPTPEQAPPAAYAQADFMSPPTTQADPLAAPMSSRKRSSPPATPRKTPASRRARAIPHDDVFHGVVSDMLEGGVYYSRPSRVSAADSRQGASAPASPNGRRVRSTGRNQLVALVLPPVGPAPLNPFSPAPSRVRSSLHGGAASSSTTTTAAAAAAAAAAAESMVAEASARRMSLSSYGAGSEAPLSAASSSAAAAAAAAAGLPWGAMVPGDADALDVSGVSGDAPPRSGSASTGGFDEQLYSAGADAPACSDGRVCNADAWADWPNRLQLDFEDVRLLGRGGGSEVRLMRKRIDGCHYAVKIVDRAQGSPCSGINEVYALAVMESCPYVVRYYDAWVQDGMLHLQTEYCEGDTLLRKMDSGHRFTESELLRIVSHVGTGLHHLHRHFLVHRDIKPENILISNHTYKIADLGLVVRGDAIDSAEGDGKYLAPEGLQKSPLLQRIDVFALGASIYELALGRRLPTSGEDWRRIRRGELEWNPQLSSAFRQLVARMMAHEPGDRPSIEEVLKDPLVQPYVRSIHDVVTLEDERAQHAQMREKLQHEMQVLRDANATLHDQVTRMREELEELRARVHHPHGRHMSS